MRNGQMRRGIVLALIALPMLAGCGQIRSHQGYIVDDTLVGSISPGVDNKQSVAQTLGRPTFAGQFDDSDWYYVSRDTRQLAFANPRPTDQLILHIRFDDGGTVADVSRIGLEYVENINPDGDKTPTLGRERSFFEDLFGNIGAVNAAGGGAGPQGGP